MSNFKRWTTYLQERSPLAALGFIAAGIAASSMAFIGEFHSSIFLLSLFFNILILIQMRLGDEIKDFDKDKVMYPTRPLPKGLLKVSEVYRALVGILVLNILVGLSIGFFRSWYGGAGLILSTVFAWLMFKEFYIGEKLNKEPMLYALTHQVIVFPIHAWVGLTLDPNLLHNKLFLGWLVANFGASFTFEICRKLNPDAHELAQTYAHHYGRKITTLICTIFILISGYGVKMAEFPMASWPALTLLWISLILWVSKPHLYKLAAAFSALSSVIILWAPAVEWLILKWS
jgi:4-hydroxybenzoate polyprenyltransferase